MSHEVTSWFIDQTVKKNSSPTRKFTIGGSDYSDRVKKWPTIKRRWDEIKPQDTVIELSNEDQTFNFFRTDKTNLVNSCSIQFGYTHPTSGDELLNLFGGTIDRLNFKSSSAKLRVIDKTKSFLETVLGTSDVPLTFSDTNYLASDIAWTLVTCYGGLSNIASTSNPDIDYAFWSQWNQEFIDDSVYVQANYEGIKINDALRRLARYTHSAIFRDDDKLVFRKFSEVGSVFETIQDYEISDNELVIEDSELINKYWVYGGYSVASDYWTINTFDTISASVNSFGTRERILKDDTIWYVNSSNSINLAQRLANIHGNHFEQFVLNTQLNTISSIIGDTVKFVDSFIGEGANNAWRIMGYDENLDNGRIKLYIDESQITTGFRLDVDCYGYLDYSHNPLL